MEEEDVLYMLSQNDFSIGSDGSGLPLHKQPEKGIPHPRNFGTFPRFFSGLPEKRNFVPCLWLCEESPDKVLIISA